MRLSIGILILTATVFTALSAFTLPPAQAASQQDLEACTKGKGDAQITGCTHIIDNGSESARDRAMAYYNRGAANFLKGQHEGARAGFVVDKRKAAIASKNAQAYYDRAIADFTEAIRLDPKYADAYNGRGFAYATKGDNDRAIADYTQAIGIDPKKARNYYFYNRGNAYRKKGDLDRAIADFTEAIRLDPKRADAYHDRGRAYATKGDKASAIADFSKAAALGSKAADEDLRKIGGKNDLALADLDKSITREPDNVIALTRRGELYAKAGKNDLALADFGKAITLEPDNVMALTRRGELYAKTGKDDLALADFGKAITLEPDNVMALTRRGELYAKAGKDDLALADLDKSITLEPDNVMALTRRGELYAKAGKDDLALADFDKAITLAKANGSAAGLARDRKAYVLRRRAKAFYDKGAYEQAVKAYDTVLALDDTDTDKKLDHISRGEAYYAMGQYKRALADFDDVIDLVQQTVDAFRRLGKIIGVGDLAPQRALIGRKKALCHINGGKNCDGPRETAAVEPKKAPAANALDKTLLASCDGKDAAKAVQACSELLKSENIDDQRRAHLYHMRGKAYAQLNKGNEALHDFIDAVKGSANPADVLIDRGELLRRYKKYDLAIKDFTAAAKLKNENGPAYFYRAKAYADAGQANADAGQIRQAERDLDQALQYLKEDKDGESDLIAQAHVMKGNIAIGERQAYHSAAKEYLTATKIHGATIGVRLTALENLAQACYSGGQYGLARDMATNLIKFRPKYAPAYNMRGMAYDNLGQQDLAIADFDKAISLDPKVYAYAYLNNRGQAYFRKGEFALAVKDYDQAIRLKPDYETAKKNKAEAEAALAKKK